MQKNLTRKPRSEQPERNDGHQANDNRQNYCASSTQPLLQRGPYPRNTRRSLIDVSTTAEDSKTADHEGTGGSASVFPHLRVCFGVSRPVQSAKPTRRAVRRG